MLLVAPAGFGKSVALRDFVETSRPAAVRYEVRREDGSLLAFVRRLSETLEPFAPSALAAFPAMQERVLATGEPVRQLSDWFAEHLKDVACAIVIDDLHYAAVDQASIALLADLVERTTHRIQWIIATRSDAGLPIASWVAYGRMDLPIGEDDLRFTTDEALAAAEHGVLGLDPQEVEALRQLTEGWPVALTIALRTRTHANDLRTASAGTRELVYRYLAEQIHAGLSPQQSEFALQTSIFSTFDIRIAQELGATPEFLSELRAKLTFLNEAATGDFRYHDLFRDFLETELRRSGETHWLNALRKGASLLEKRGDVGDALALFVKAKAGEDVMRILTTSGVALFERGYGEVLASALEIMSDRAYGSDAALLGLEAMIDAARGRFELAERNFLTAIERAQDRIELRMALVHRYTIELVRNERDCVAFLEPYALNPDVPSTLQIPLLSTLATGYVHTGRYAEAVTAIDRALQLLGPSIEGETLARVYQQAAYVQRYAGSTEKAQMYANIAVELALQGNLFDLAARAYSILYTIAHDEADDPLMSLAILEKVSECARKSASARARIFALIASYEIEVDRSDETALERLDREIGENPANLRLITTALLPARALRSAWNGAFSDAYDLLAGSAATQMSPEQEALRWSELALYATAAGRREEAETAIVQSNAALDKSDPRKRRTIRARLFLTAAELVRGHDAAAHRQLTEAERAVNPRLHRILALLQAMRVLYRVHLEQSDPQALDVAYERLRAEHLGGLARLLAALPVAPSAGGSGVGALTPAEREILQQLAGGASTKQIALLTGRSPHTIDTHIRSICRKLSCKGRREAVALATSRGWVQSLPPAGG